MSMSEGKVNKFLKVTRDNHQYKLYLDDLNGIYKFRFKQTPPLKPYDDLSDDLNTEASLEFPRGPIRSTGTLK